MSVCEKPASQRARRARRAASGMCPECGRAPPLARASRCADCRALHVPSVRIGRVRAHVRYDAEARAYSGELRCGAGYRWEFFQIVLPDDDDRLSPGSTAALAAAARAALRFATALHAGERPTWAPSEATAEALARAAARVRYQRAPFGTRAPLGPPEE